MKSDEEIRNISYSFQYIEYLEQTLIELSLSAVLRKQTYKTYVITGIGIIECMFVNLCKQNGVAKDTLHRAVEFVDDNKILSSRPTLCKRIHQFRELRNRVHLNVKANRLESDYHAFDLAGLRQIRSIIYELVTCTELLPETQYIRCAEFLQRKL